MALNGTLFGTFHDGDVATGPSTNTITLMFDNMGVSGYGKVINIGPKGTLAPSGSAVKIKAELEGWNTTTSAWDKLGSEGEWTTDELNDPNKYQLLQFPLKHPKKLRIAWTVTGTITSGGITAGIDDWTERPNPEYNPNRLP